MIAVGIVGMGKIARDQHVPAIRADPRFTLAATADPYGALDGVLGFPDLRTLLASGIALDAVAICTPPAARRALAAEAIDAGLAVLLEKPPAATVSQAAELVARAANKGTTLFAAWHSRAASGVAAARAWLADRRVLGGRIAWREDIRHWHPGQEWIVAAGGFGVFNPAINALSILTAILPQPAAVTGATMDVPQGRASPLAATVALRAGAAPILAELDFLQTGPQSWTIEIDTDAGALRLEDGGERLWIAGERVAVPEGGEYPRLYARFAELIAAGASDADLSPLQLVADAFLIAERRTTAPFSF